MTRKLVSVKTIGFNQIFILLFLLLTFTQSYAKSGCCSHHGGVAGCDSNTGYQLCRDGSDSPSCLCDNSSATDPKMSVRGE